MSRRDREIIVHRVTGRCGAEHEWGLHATSLAGTVGLSEVQVDDTVAPSLTPGYWTEDEIRLMAVVDELADSTDVCDASWQFLKRRYNEQQLIEFILLVGWCRAPFPQCASSCAYRHTPSADVFRNHLQAAIERKSG